MIFEVDYSPHIIKTNQLLRRIQESLLRLNNEEAIGLLDEAITELRLARTAVNSSLTNGRSQTLSPE